MFSQPLRSVAPAAFARLQDDRASMTAALRSIIGLLSAVTVPICLVLCGAARPIIEFVYGRQWAPAAPVLTWLAVLAAFRILFELVYDYLVVLGRSRAIFAVQLVWLVVLVPGLVLAARIGGLNAMAPVQVAIAAGVIVPLYMREIRRSGLSASAVGRRLGYPLAGGLVVWAVAWSLADLVSSRLLACLLAGGFCLAVIAVLIYRDRLSLRALRELGRGRGQS